MNNYYKYQLAFEIAVSALKTNGFRSFLTALGIIFGVAAVIAMLAIGAGAEQEINEKMKLVGVNNIIVSKQVINPLESSNTERKKASYSSGLCMADASEIKDLVPSVAMVSPLLEFESFVLRKGRGEQLKLKGVSKEYFKMFNYQLVDGSFFSEYQEKNGSPVCIIGTKVVAKLFHQESPVGKKIKCNKVWFTVIGVFQSQTVNETVIHSAGVVDYNLDIYAPCSTLLLRYRNRAALNQSMLEKNAQHGSEEEKPTPQMIDINQIDQIIVQVKETGQLSKTAEVLSRYLKRRHRNVEDFEITIPELQLKAEQDTKDLMNNVLIGIAAISLLVGGIGIMNIMLASVMERIKEIGLRMALGATQIDITNQFLFEAVFLSVGGGLVGILAGVLIAKSISFFAGILTIVNFSAVFISFSVSAAVGLIFGITPAMKAAKQNPVDSLRN